MLASQKLAIAAHMHVLLRRKTGRVTDTEWMAQNLEYALEVVRFARAKADEDQLPELREWADKLETAVLSKSDAPSKQPLVQAAVQLLRDRGGVTAAAPEAPAEPEAPLAGRTGSFKAVPASKSSSSGPDSQLEGDPEKKRDPSVPRYVGGIR